ncbi:sugar-binding domain-containing protein [Flavobacterium sp. FZUC8N2.13]|uniref:Sugar-binding domain-containing protein n=1 Tax=Flavobacterium zubiriense TaxID=3138075 RepID=A0ABV4TGX1_9FLAO
MKNKILSFPLLFLLIFMFTDCKNDSSVKKINKDYDEAVLSLDGNWEFAIDSTKLGYKKDWVNGIPSKSSRTVKVPHTWNIEDKTEDYFGLAWYQKEIKLPSGWKGKNIRIKFEAVYHDAVVYVNGKKVGENSNAGYTPFTLDITKFVSYEKSNIIVVSVNNEFSKNNLPYEKSFDWGNDGGIIRSVSIKATGKPSFKYVHVTPKIELKDSTGIIKVVVKLWEKNVNEVQVDFNIKDQKTAVILKTVSKKLKVINGECSTSIYLGKIKPWHFDSPNLYELESEIKTDLGITDKQFSVFGFKKVEIVGDQFFLNGESIRLPGIEYMPGSNPKYGIVEPKRYMDSIVRSMKDLNICITRFHWQQDDYMLSLMDKYGILVQEELPWWQNPKRLTPQLVLTAHKQLSDMIDAHYNHPSVFSWGISNEINGDTDKKTYIALRNFVKNKDSMRFVTIVSNRIWEKQKEDETLLGDIPTWNEYIGTWHGKDRNELPNKFDIVKSAIGKRPLLITENGLCEPANSGGDTRRIDDMLFHIKEWSSQPYVMGYIYFCLNDYRTQMGEEGFGKFKIRRHGITDVALNPKPSYYVLKQLASPVDITKVERVNNSTAKIEIKVKNTIPSYTLRGYKLQYKNNANKLFEIKLPILKAGDTFAINLKEINARFAFQIVRPDGFLVIKY